MAETVDDIQEKEEDTQRGRYLTFSLDNECYGIEIRYVTEIINMQLITRIPELPDYFKGVINLRGKIIPVLDIRIRFKKEPREYHERTCIIVIEVSDMSVGLIVDSVAEVLTIPEENIVEPPQMGQGASGQFIRQVGKIGNDVILLADCEKLLSEDIVENINLIT